MTLLDDITQRVWGIWSCTVLCWLQKLGKWSEDKYETQRLTNSHWAKSEGAVFVLGCRAATQNHPNGEIEQFKQRREVCRCSNASIISSSNLKSQPMPCVTCAMFPLRPRFWLGRWRASLWRQSEPRRRPLWPPTAATSTPSSAGSCAFWVSCTRRDWRLFHFCAVRHRGSLRLFCKPQPQFRPPVAPFQFASVDLFSSSSCLSNSL